jgi:hypothetical protein
MPLLRPDGILARHTVCNLGLKLGTRVLIAATKIVLHGATD